jgi:hypothetical protein
MENVSGKRPVAKMSSSMYKLVQTINSTKFRTEPFEDFYETFEEIGTYVNQMF